jgi:hypothetical protein
MKKLLTLSFLLTVLLSYSQTMTLEGSRFYLDGKRLETREARQLLNTNYESASLYKQAKSKEAVGGFLLGFGIGLTVGDLAVGLFSDTKYPGTMTYVGVGSLVASIPVISGRKKLYEKAADIYNKEHKNGKLGAAQPSLELNLISNRAGMGLQLKF